MADFSMDLPHQGYMKSCFLKIVLYTISWTSKKICEAAVKV